MSIQSQVTAMIYRQMDDGLPKATKPTNRAQRRQIAKELKKEV